MPNIPENPDFLNYGRIVRPDADSPAMPVPIAGQLVRVGLIDTNYTEIGKLDTALGHALVAFQLNAEENSVIFKIQGSIDDDSWFDLKTYDEAEAVRSSVDITVSPGTAGNPEFASLGTGILGSFRYFRVMAKNAVAGAHHGIADVWVIAK